MNHSQPPHDESFDAQDAQASLDAAEQELGQIEQQLAAAQEEVLRTRAEMDNLRKRLMREMDTARKFAGERILGDLLPVADSLEQGLAAVADTDPAREGLQLTWKQFASALERHGLTVVDPTGQAFDPAEHQAISAQPSSDQPENTVLAVLQKGYRLHERVLRPALVIVSKAADDA